MTTRRQIIIAMGATTLIVPLASPAQQGGGKVSRIGWLSSASASSGGAELDALRQGLNDLGYAEGKSFVIESRWADGNAAALPALASSLVRANVDVICANATQAALAAKRATTTIPIVFTRTVFPDQTGLVATLAHPGGNATGLAFFIGSEYGKQLELLREIDPRLARVAVLYNDSNRASNLAVSEIERWAAKLGVALERYGVHSRETLASAFAAIPGKHPDGLMTTADPVVASFRREIVAFSAKQRLVSIYPDSAFAEVGGLIGYGRNLADMTRRAAIYVDKILKGVKPADLPVEQPTKFELVVNMKTAKIIGAAIPQSILLRADRVIE